MNKHTKGIYKAWQCTDINDCNIAIAEVEKRIRELAVYPSILLPHDQAPRSLYKRLISLTNKRGNIIKRQLKPAPANRDKNHGLR